MKVFLVGCGNIGSYLSLILSSNLITEEIIIVDSGILSGKGEIYTFRNITDQIGCPKSLVLMGIIKESRPDIRIIPFYGDYALYKNLKTDDHIGIDCRDTSHEDSLFDFKLCLDAGFGQIIRNPTTELTNRMSVYIKKPDPYTTITFCTFVTSIIFNSFNSSKERLVETWRTNEYNKPTSNTL